MNKLTSAQMDSLCDPDRKPEVFMCLHGISAIHAHPKGQQHGTHTDTVFLVSAVGHMLLEDDPCDTDPVEDHRLIRVDMLFDRERLEGLSRCINSEVILSMMCDSGASLEDQMKFFNEMIEKLKDEEEGSE